jgi:hypothetical protein
MRLVFPARAVVPPGAGKNVVVMPDHFTMMPHPPPIGTERREN